jgi:hypothetical protein
MNTREQYIKETQHRLLKFLQSDEQREQEVRKRNVEGKRKKSIPPQAEALPPLPVVITERQQEVLVDKVPWGLGMNQYGSAKYKVRTIILDSGFRDPTTHREANDFVVKLVEPLKDVLALRILRTEFYQPCNTQGYFVLNQVKIPIQLYNIESAYLYINGYTNTTVANETNTNFIGRIGPGTEVFPAVTGSITQDPYVYMFYPVEPKLKRFHVRLLQADGSVYPVQNARVVITLALYCVR